MDAPLPTKIEYATARTIRRWRSPRSLIAFVVVLALYVGSYVVLRAFVDPAANMAFFIYPGSATVNEWCYYGFWPLYKVDRFLTGRTHNLDRTPWVMPDGDVGGSPAE